MQEHRNPKAQRLLAWLLSRRTGTGLFGLAAAWLSLGEGILV